jgi:iron complex outermembrane receptor protein
MEGAAHGVEMWGSYQASRTWRLSAGLTLLDMDLRRKPGSTDPFGPSALGNDPEYQWNLRSSWDLTPRHELDIMVRRIGTLPDPKTPAYTAVDARLGWRINRHAALSLALNNLFDSAHTEYSQSTVQGEFGRSVFLQLQLRE